MASYSDEDISNSDSTDITITQVKTKIRSTLEHLDWAGSFAYFGKIEHLVDPHICVRGLGRIKLPLTEESAQSLIKTCHQSPFGKGDKTIIDTSVRNTWELNNDQFNLENHKWKEELGCIVDKALVELGLNDNEACDTEAQLYKMLLYEKGAMFKAHKDSEKVPGMFGTLVICLPSEHKGGVIKLQHSKQSREYRTDCFFSSYACWYSDVTHEVTEVTSGYRWVLTYNLVNKSSIKQPSAAKVQSDLKELRCAFKYWQKDKDHLGQDRFIHILKHKYTEASFRFNTLKPEDLVTARALQEVCVDTNCTLFLASCERKIYGGCEDEYSYDYDYNYYDEDEEEEDDDDDEEDEDDDDDEENEDEVGYRSKINRQYGHSQFRGDYHRIVDVCNDMLSLIRVVDLNGVTVAEDFSINETDFVEDFPFDDRDPDDEDYSGFTGNEGVSATHWYRDSVIIAVPNTLVPKFLMRPFTQENTIPHMNLSNAPKSRFGVKDLLSYLRTRLQLDESNKLNVQYLDRVCRMILSRQRNIVFKKPFSKDTIDQIIEASIEMQNLDLLENASKDVSGVLPIHVYSKIGAMMKETSFERLQSVLNVTLFSAKAVHERYSAIVALQISLIEGEIVPLSEVTTQKLNWLDSKIDEVLEEQHELLNCPDLFPEDGKALVEIFNSPGKLGNIQEKVIAKVKRNISQTSFVVEFLSSFFNPEGGHELRKEAAVKVLAPLLQDLIPAFNLKPRNVMQAFHVSHLHSNANFFKWSFSQEKPTIEPIVAPVQGDALARLFNTILSLRLHEEASHLLNQIQREAEVQDAKYFPVMFLPFLQFMIPVWSAQGIEYDDHICQSLYQSILRSCLLRYVGKRPQPPTHWSRAPVSCRCADCSWLNSFLVDKEKSVDYFSIAEKRRKHLQYQLQGGDCTYITQQNGIPYTLVVTKTRRAYEKLLTEWKRRCKDYVNETTGKFRRTVLRQLLGSEFEELTSVVLLDSSLPVTRQLIPSAGNSRASAAPEPRVSPKRIAGTKRKAIEIIDLT